MPGTLVVVWILPQTEATLADQSKATEVPAERWARSRNFGEKFKCIVQISVLDDEKSLTSGSRVEKIRHQNCNFFRISRGVVSPCDLIDLLSTY